MTLIKKVCSLQLFYATTRKYIITTMLIFVRETEINYLLKILFYIFAIKIYIYILRMVNDYF